MTTGQSSQYRVDILMATYNGEKYIAQQLDSILNQTFQDWRLMIRDDGSSDKTVAIMNEYALQHPDKIIVIPQAQHLGPKENFAGLLNYSQAPYTMFCDQDDVWLPTKVAVTLDAMTDLEKRLGTDLPLLVYTDLVVVDDELSTIDQSFFHYIRNGPYFTLKSLLMQNTVAGCTVMMNQTLREMTPSIPDDAIMHDWWMGLIAAAFGKIVCLSESTILYRQHNTNTAGAKKGSFRRVLHDLFLGAWRRDIKGSQVQAAAFRKFYEGRLDGATNRMIIDYASLSDKSFFVRKWIIIKYHLYAGKIMHALGILLFI